MTASDSCMWSLAGSVTLEWGVVRPAVILEAVLYKSCNTKAVLFFFTAPEVLNHSYLFSCRRESYKGFLFRRRNWPLPVHGW